MSAANLCLRKVNFAMLTPPLLLKVQIDTQKPKFVVYLQVEEFILLLYNEIKVFSSASLTSIAGVL